MKIRLPLLPFGHGGLGGVHSHGYKKVVFMLKNTPILSRGIANYSLTVTIDIA